MTLAAAHDGQWGEDHTMRSDATDAQIIAASLTDPSVFAPIFERHFDAIYGYVSRRLGRDAAEDVASEVFTIAIAKRGSFDGSRDSALPWLYGIASNLVSGARRSAARKQGAVAKLAWQRDATPTETPTGSIARIDAAATTRSLQSAIDALGDRDRNILLLHAWADLTYTDIAEALAMPVGTVRSRMHRIRKSLNATLAAKEARNA